jgi:hypothetical protein
MIGHRRAEGSVSKQTLAFHPENVGQYSTLCGYSEVETFDHRVYNEPARPLLPVGLASSSLPFVSTLCEQSGDCYRMDNTIELATSHS